jgi:carboxyl-terminal processing protease
MYKDSVAIRPIENGPSAKAEYKQGIGSYMLIEQNYLDVSYLVIVFSKLKGEQGSVVELTIYRKSADKKIKIKRGVIPIKSVDVAVLNDSTGYIKSIVLPKPL